MPEEIIYYNDTEDPSKFLDILNRLDNNAEVKSILILMADGSSAIKDKVAQDVRSIKKNLFGGFFPQIVYNSNLYDKGCLIVGLSINTQTYQINKISDTGENIESQIETISKKINNTTSMFVYVDGLSSGVGSFIESVYNHLGSEHNYIGGGCGSLSFKQSPCIITNDGLFEDSALIVSTNSNIGVGVSHGWQKLAGPFRVTESSKNKIISLDWEPAFNIYKNIVDEHSSRKINKDNFFEISKSYPFGVNKIDTEVVVRDPIFVEGSQLVCVGEVRENEYVNILNGSESSLINAAIQAKNIAIDKVTKVDKSMPLLLMDCVSRALFLENNFSKELIAIQGNNKSLVGALCLGEIANSGNSCLEFFNKTCVVGVIEKVG